MHSREHVVSGLPAAARRRTDAPRRRVTLDDWRQSSIFPYLLVTPALTALGTILLYPIVLSVYLSLHAIDGAMFDGAPFIGLRNYERMLGQEQFWSSLRVTFTYTSVSVAGIFLTGLGAALIMNEEFRGRTLARLLLIVPWAMPPAVAVLIWAWSLDPTYGVINYVLILSGAIDQGLAWTADSVLAMVTAIVVSIWKFFPIPALLMLAALQTIPKDLYEAASIDGANRLQRFRYITLPGLKPVAAALLLLITITSFRQFTVIFILTGGGPARATETLVVQTFLQAFSFYRMGYAAALGTVTLVISLVFSASYLAVLSRRDRA